MTLIRQYRPSARITFDELDGLLKLLSDRIDDAVENDNSDFSYYIGAYMALEIIRYHEQVDIPQDFMRLLELRIERNTDA